MGWWKSALPSANGKEKRRRSWARGLARGGAECRTMVRTRDFETAGGGVQHVAEQSILASSVPHVPQGGSGDRCLLQGPGPEAGTAHNEGEPQSCANRPSGGSTALCLHEFALLTPHFHSPVRHKPGSSLTLPVFPTPTRISFKSCLICFGNMSRCLSCSLSGWAMPSGSL